mgnify:CR=1 FL=1
MSKARLLIVEDDVDISNMLKIYFSSQGYEIETALRGNEALEKTRQAMPHLIVLDIMLPDINGYEVCRQLRKDKETARVPILMLTARGEEEDRIQLAKVAAMAALDEQLAAAEHARGDVQPFDFGRAGSGRGVKVAEAGYALVVLRDVPEGAVQEGEIELRGLADAPALDLRWGVVARADAADGGEVGGADARAVIGRGATDEDGPRIGVAGILGRQRERSCQGLSASGPNLALISVRSCSMSPGNSRSASIDGGTGRPAYMRWAMVVEGVRRSS